MEDRKGAQESYDHAESLLRAMAQGDRSPAQVLAELLADLESRCRPCGGALAEYPREVLVERAGGSYEEAIGAASRAAVERTLDLARERDEAEELLQELLAEPVLSRAIALAAASPRFHTWGLATRAVDRAEEALLEQSQAARYWAELAVEVAYSLDERRYGTRVVEDQRAVARTLVARSLLADPGTVGWAERELGRAGRHAAAGTGLDGVRLELALAYAEVLLAQGRWQKAVDVLGGIGDRDDLGADPGYAVRAARLTAETFRQAGEVKMAVSALRGALVASAAGRDRDGHGREAGLDLLEVLCQAEWFDDAAAELAEQERRFPRIGPPRAEARKQWLRARIYEGSGRVGEAQRAYAEARVRLAEAGEAVLAARAALRGLRLLLADSVEAEALRLVGELAALYELPELPYWCRIFLFRLQAEALGDGLDLAAVEAVEAALATPPGVYEGLETTPDGPAN